MNTIWLAFITGLTTGGISCFAVQGGLLASALTNREGQNQKPTISMFLVSKIVAYTLLGALLGLLGSSLVITPKLQGLMQILAGLFMLATVGRLLDIHPVFRRFVITPPKAVYKLLRGTAKENDLLAPGLLGFLTVLIPCGVTQAMMLLAVASGNPVLGALIMFAFTLGTSPIFFVMGLASEQMLKRQALKYFAGAAILILGILSINTGQVLRGSAHTLQNYWLAATGGIEATNVYAGSVAGVNKDGTQEVEITVSTNGYHSSAASLKAGVTTTVKLVTNNTFGCSRAFTIPEYNISTILPETGVKTVTFTPNRKGRLTFSCSMGMYTGYFNVI